MSEQSGEYVTMPRADLEALQARLAAVEEERKRLQVLLANESHEYEDDYAFSWAAIAYLGFSGNMDAYDEWVDAQVAAGRAEVQGKEARGE